MLLSRAIGLTARTPVIPPAECRARSLASDTTHVTASRTSSRSVRRLLRQSSEIVGECGRITEPKFCSDFRSFDRDHGWSGLRESNPRSELGSGTAIFLGGLVSRGNEMNSSRMLLQLDRLGVPRATTYFDPNDRLHSSLTGVRTITTNGTPSRGSSQSEADRDVMSTSPWMSKLGQVCNTSLALPSDRSCRRALSVIVRQSEGASNRRPRSNQSNSYRPTPETSRRSFTSPTSHVTISSVMAASGCGPEAPWHQLRSGHYGVRPTRTSTRSEDPRNGAKRI